MNPPSDRHPNVVAGNLAEQLQSDPVAAGLVKEYLPAAEILRLLDLPDADLYEFLQIPDPADVDNDGEPPVVAED